MKNAKQFPPELGEAMTAAAILCRRALGLDEEAAPILADAVGLVLAKPPVWQPDTGHVDYCYWFFGTEALRRVGGEPQRAWGEALVGALVDSQRADGAAAGSWDPVDPWGANGGRVYATAMAVLALQGLAALPDTDAAAGGGGERAKAR